MKEAKGLEYVGVSTNVAEHMMLWTASAEQLINQPSFKNIVCRGPQRMLDELKESHPGRVADATVSEHGEWHLILFHWSLIPQSSQPKSMYPLGAGSEPCEFLRCGCICTRKYRRGLQICVNIASPCCLDVTQIPRHKDSGLIQGIIDWGWAAR